MSGARDELVDGKHDAGKQGEREYDAKGAAARQGVSTIGRTPKS
jgi:hypothetical protein